MQSLRLIFVLAVAASLLSGCFLTDVLPGEEKPKPKAGRIAPGTLPPAVPLLPPPGQLAPAQLARRLALDLAQRLPSEADVTLLQADPKQYAPLVDAYLGQRDAARALADLHPRMWRLDARSLPDLDAFVAAGDPTIGRSLTPTMRRVIVDEPALMLRFALEQGLPFPGLFTSSFTVVGPRAVSFWRLTDEGEAWPGEPHRFALFPDGRPAAGLLAANGLLAAYPSRDDPTHRRRTARVLQALACQSMENATAHSFYDLQSPQLRGDLATIAATRAPCAGCHAHIAQAAPAFEGLGEGASFAAWRTYAAPATPGSGLYGGAPYEGLAQLGALMGADPRVHRCEIERLTTALLQRPFNDRDAERVALALTRFNESGYDLKSAARELVLANDYKVAPIAAATDSSAMRGASGVKVLRREQWRGILQQLAPQAGDIELPLALDPGFSEAVDDGAFVPSGEYYAAADRVARLASAAIVDAELAPGAVAAARRVLLELPDGIGTNASAPVVQRQIIALWRRLTAEDLTEASPLTQALYTLWTETDPAAGTAEFKQAWRVVLVAMLTHPTFLTY